MFGSPLESILIGKIKLFLSREPQETPKGREVVFSGVFMNETHPGKWVNGILKFHWIYKFKYIDDDTFIDFEFDYNGNFLKKN